MRIVMLGHTGVGKTTYMASLYGIMQQGIQGFSLRATGSENHTHFINLSKRISQGHFPTATDQRQEYKFGLRYQGMNVINFSWSDYRGGSIREYQESQQAKGLNEDLKTADGMMLFYDSKALLAGKHRENQIGRITALTNHALKELDHPISLAIVLTKTDLLVEFPTQLLESLNGIISSIEASSLIRGTIIPVACGSKLCNISMPLLFSLHAAVQLKATTAQKNVSSHQTLAELYDSKSRGVGGVANWVVSKFKDEATFHSKAREEREKATEQQREFDKIRSPAQALSHYVQKLPTIKSNLTPEDYIKKISQVKEGIIKKSLSPVKQDPFSIFD